MLDCAVADELYTRFPQVPEGKLTQLRSSLVRHEALVVVARELGLDQHVHVGATPIRDSVLGDSLEAIFGAIFLDGGYPAARRAVVQAFGRLLDALDPGTMEKDAKTRLQELMHARGKPVPEYRVVATHGEPHQPSFEVECRVEGSSSTGGGTSRQRAEQEAAKAMLDKLQG